MLNKLITNFEKKNDIFAFGYDNKSNLIENKRKNFIITLKLKIR